MTRPKIYAHTYPPTYMSTSLREHPEGAMLDPQRLVIFETQITILTIENLNS